MTERRTRTRPKPSDFFFSAKDNICHVTELSGSRFVRAGLNAVHTLRHRTGSELTSMQSRGEMYMVTVYLTDHQDAQDVWKDGRHAMRPKMRAGSVSLFDMRYHWEGDNMAPFEALNFFIPDVAFAETAREMGGSFSAFEYDVTQELRDDVSADLARSLLPAIDRQNEVSSLYVDHVFAALRTHLLEAHAGVRPLEVSCKGLSDVQVARVKELLLDDIGVDRSVGELAGRCGLSDAHFARSFKQTFGTSPHRWLLEQRVAHAKRLLGEELPISEIALASGFADQSHMTRVFTRVVGISPGRFRRFHGSDQD